MGTLSDRMGGLSLSPMEQPQNGSERGNGEGEATIPPQTLRPGISRYGGEVRKGKMDKREYRVVYLENGLQALLISTRHCPVAPLEVCVCVRVGRRPWGTRMCWLCYDRSTHCVVRAVFYWSETRQCLSRLAVALLSSSVAPVSGLIRGDRAKHAHIAHVRARTACSRAHPSTH